MASCWSEIRENLDIRSVKRTILKCVHVILIPDLNGSKLSCSQAGKQPETLMCVKSPD